MLSLLVRYARDITPPKSAMGLFIILGEEKSLTQLLSGLRNWPYCALKLLFLRLMASYAAAAADRDFSPS